MVKYTIAICNYNMQKTLERSIRSINDMIDDRFEILVVDDGSTDASVDILESLADELDRVRFTVNQNKYYFQTRREANNLAEGEYILVELDTDDEYLFGIQDFVTVFHQIEDQIDFDPFLSGNHIHMASKELFNRINFRNLGYGGGRDLWRRMIVDGSFVGLHHKSIKRSIGYDRSGIENVSTRFEHIITQFRSGITPQSYATWLTKKLAEWRPTNDLNLMAVLFNLASTAPAYLLAARIGIYDDLPTRYSDMGCYTKILTSNKMALPDIEAYFDIEIDRSALTDKGKDIFDPPREELFGPRYWLNEPMEIGLTPDQIDC